MSKHGHCGRAHAQVLACALLQELGASADGVECGELAAFCVHPSYRGSGRGDSLLDYVEQRARDKGIRRLVLSSDSFPEYVVSISAK
jgi:N-acetylglutamate synthase-like GNAT family acetyltransferase